jgi:hypothetical protein
VDKTPNFIKYALLTGLLAFAAGCVVRPVGYRDGYWDREHGRYWLNNGWHPCAERADYCR